MTAFIPGLLAGLIHVFSGPDHLAALGSLAVRRRRAAWSLGFRWGLGHSLGVAVVGVAALLLRGFLDLERLSFWSERAVGVTLIALGLWGCRSLLRDRVHAHAHHHGDGTEHVHFHVHSVSGAHDVAPTDGHARNDEAPVTHRHDHAAFVVGTIHGAAGTSHLLGILPALLLPTRMASLGYLAGFCGGSIGAMVCFTHLVGFASSRTAAGSLRAYRGLLAGAAVSALAVGLVWLLLPLAEGLPR